MSMSECCQMMFLFLAYVVVTVGSIAYSFYLIWLLTYLKNNWYWFFAFIPALLGIPSVSALASSGEKENFVFILFSVMILEMCLFTMLTREAYYHLPVDVLIGPKWVIVSLKGSIIFFVSTFLIEKECQLQKILKGKDILSCCLLDFVDIFNLVELLSLNQCVGIGSTVTEGSSLEKAIQAFCTMSLVIIPLITSVTYLDENNEEENDNENKKKVVFTYFASVCLQNLPFLIIRIIIWAKYNVYSLGFIAKNVMVIAVFLMLVIQEGREGRNICNDAARVVLENVSNCVAALE